MYLAHSNVDLFRHFVIDLPAKRSQQYVCLADFIFAWLESGKASKHCLGNFGVYAQSVVAIIIEWERNDRQLDCTQSDGTVAPRRIERIAVHSLQDSGSWLDRERFASFSYDELGHPLSDVDQP